MECQQNFRLGTYIISAFGDSVFTWTTNAAFGSTRSGRCFLVGNVLILLSWEQKALGYLRLEFQRNQMKFPAWDLSRYYCLSNDLNLPGKRNLAPEECLAYLTLKDGQRTPAVGGPGRYRLDRYEIRVAARGKISWITTDTPGKAAIGPARIESGILFLGPKHGIIDCGPVRTFHAELRSFPPWKQTGWWGYEASLRSCAAKGPGRLRVALRITR